MEVVPHPLKMIFLGYSHVKFCNEGPDTATMLILDEADLREGVYIILLAYF